MSGPRSSVVSPCSQCVPTPYNLKLTISPWYNDNRCCWQPFSATNVAAQVEPTWLIDETPALTEKSGPETISRFPFASCVSMVTLLPPMGELTGSMESCAVADAGPLIVSVFTAIPAPKYAIVLPWLQFVWLPVIWTVTDWPCMPVFGSTLCSVAEAGGSIPKPMVSCSLTKLGASTVFTNTRSPAQGCVRGDVDRSRQLGRAMHRGRYPPPR